MRIRTGGSRSLPEEREASAGFMSFGKGIFCVNYLLDVVKISTFRWRKKEMSCIIEYVGEVYI